MEKSIHTMSNQEYLKMFYEMELNKHSYYNEFDTPFNEYMKYPDGKYVIAITKCQYVFNAKLDGDHAFMATDLIRAVRPDLEVDDWGNPYNGEENFSEHNVFLVGYNNYSLLSIPEKEMLSIEQYNKIEEILLDIKENNERKIKNGRSIWELFIDAPKNMNLESGNYENRIDEALEALKNYVTENYEKPNEVIVGTPLSKNKKL